MLDRACEILPVHFYAHSALGSMHPTGPDPGYPWVTCVAYSTKEAALCLWEIPQMLRCTLLLCPVPPCARLEVFKECGSWILSPPEKLRHFSPVRSVGEKQDSSRLIYDASASDVDNLHLLHSLWTPFESMRRNKHF